MVGTIKQDAEGMAACIAQLTQNTADGKELVDGVEKDMISEKRLLTRSSFHTESTQVKSKIQTTIS